jgi:hypothetical protein
MESYVGRFWVDYPLGFYLGPDAIDLNLYLSYGIPGVWEAQLHWNMNGQGSIDLYGWGNDNDYTHAGEEGYPLSGAPTGIVLHCFILLIKHHYTIITPPVVHLDLYRLF